MASERRTPMRSVRVDLLCDDCGAVLESTGIVKTSFPEWYVHKCSGCDKLTDERRQSGRIVWEAAPPAPEGEANG